ncbi:MAG: chromosomal replication initiator protein DnaA [Clostridium sp.]|nr:chromosomal replication initiator protein DnaA [Clostridium sp.]
MTNCTPHIDKWENCLQFFRDNLTPEHFNTWFRPITFLGYADSRVTLYVPSSFFVERLEETQFFDLMCAALRREFGKDVRLTYKYDIKANEPEARVTVDSSNPSPAVMPRSAVPANPFLGAQARSSEWLEPQLNPHYTFANYCGSHSNQVARSIGEAIAADPRCKTFNPLFVFGQPGVGKTHLMQAIGIRTKELYPQMRVLYITARLFQSQFTTAERTGKTNEFLNFYQSIDMLILDDIQDLVGKPKTQNAFFHIFNHLHLNQKQLIMSSDCCPANMDGMEERLLSRFKWGMTAELSSPDYELRKRVIELKTKQDGIQLPQEVAEFITNNVTNSIREIEGVIVSLVTHATVLNRPIDLDLARLVMANSVKSTRRQINFEMITEKVSEFYNIDPEKLFSRSRKREVSDARQMVMYMAKKHANMPMTTIGARLARSHATVIYACTNIEQRLPLEKQLQEEVAKIESALIG